MQPPSSRQRARITVNPDLKGVATVSQALPWPRLERRGLVGQTADPASIAGSVVEAVTQALALLRPAVEGLAGHG